MRRSRRLPDRAVFLLRPAAAVLTGVLLASAFPRPGIAGLAWIALVPLLLAAGRDGSPAFLLGWIAGAVWQVPSLSWLRFVTTAGWLSLALFLALFTALWAFGAKQWFAWAQRGGSPRDLAAALAAACWWVGLEWVKGRIFTGFPWNDLGASQYRQIAVIQVARIGGVYAVSFLVVFLNAALALSIERIRRRVRRPGRRGMPHLSIAVALLLVAVAVSYGLHVALAPATEPGRPVRVALVQGNIPQSIKWDESFGERIIERYDSLTRQAAVAEPDLIVWPETATPGDLRYDSRSADLVIGLLEETGVPMVVGSVDVEFGEGASSEVRETNSAFFLQRDPGDPSRVVWRKYDKIHLVPFGEYVPMERWALMRKLTPIAGSVTPGREMKVFELPGGARFSCLICFEDVFPDLGRSAAAAGADFLVNITNDGWYGRSSGPFQHAANAVFRAVENDRPLVRAANTGLSCIIDRFGRMTRVLEGERPGDIWISGVLIGEITVRPGAGLTFYTRYGDLFALWGLVVGMAAHAPLFSGRFRRFRTRRDHGDD